MSDCFNSQQSCHHFLTYKMCLLVSVAHRHTCQQDVSVCHGRWLSVNNKADISANKEGENWKYYVLVLALNWGPPFGTTWWSRWSRSTLSAGWDPSWWGVKRSAGLCIVAVWLVHLKTQRLFLYVHLKQTALLLWWWISWYQQHLYKHSAVKGTTANV